MLPLFTGVPVIMLRLDHAINPKVATRTRLTLSVDTHMNRAHFTRRQRPGIFAPYQPLAHSMQVAHTVSAITPSLNQGYLAYTFTANIARSYIRATLLKSNNPTLTLCLNAVLCYDTCLQSPRTLFVHDFAGLGPSNAPLCNACGRSIALLDMNVAQSSIVTNRGPVVPQRLAAPQYQSGRTRLAGARLELPIFFQREDNGLPGLTVADALSGRLPLMGMADPACLGGKSSTYICINVGCHPFMLVFVLMGFAQWPGLPAYKRQIQTKDQTQQKKPITLARFVKHVGRSVQLFCESAESHFLETHDIASPWMIGQGGINMDDLLIIGVAHVSPGAFQTILQLTQPRTGVPIP